MKLIYLLFLLFLFNFNYCSKGDNEKRKKSFFDQDSNFTINLITNLREIEDSDIALLTIHIINMSQTSILILPEPFLVNTNFLDNHFPWVGGNRYTTPNIVYFKRKDEHFNFQSDGIFLYEYDSFPKMILLNSMDSASLTIDVRKELLNNTTLNEIDYSGWIIYSDYNFAYSIAKNLNEEIQRDFNSNLSDTFNEKINLLTLKKIENSLSEININEITKFIRVPL